MPLLAQPFRRTLSILATAALALSLTGFAPAPAAAGAPLATVTAQPAVATVVPTATRAATPLKVGTFNIRCANCSTGSRVNSREKNWETRRGAVIAQIRSEAPHVFGVQEASPGVLKSNRSRSQYDDLVARLGGSYKITDASRYNCAKSTSYKKCRKVDQDASGDARIIYNSSRLAMLDHGSRQLDKEKATSGPRFVAWAIFRDKTDGRKFLFATAHTEPGQSKAKVKLRKKQAGLILDELRKHNPAKLPVILTGDFSSTKLTHAGNPVYDIITKSGLVRDPLGNTRKKKSLSSSVVSKVVNVQYDTLNDFRTSPTKRRGYALGAHLDYILTSKSIKVTQYKVVLSLKNGKFAGVIPSDHNMVTAVVLLP